jgi:hypothetical protein
MFTKIEGMYTDNKKASKLKKELARLT